MNALRRSTRSGSDEGMTLVEVIAAVIIVVIVSLSGAALTINGLQTASAQERNQVAVTIANGQMEALSGWTVSTNTSTGVSNLYTGRCLANVTSGFTAEAAASGVSQTYPQWDPVATANASCSAPTFPVVTTTTENGTKYTIYDILGACYEAVEGGNCSTISGDASAPAVVPAGYTQVIREIVIVNWTAGSTCVKNGCSYETTSLVDANPDLQWVAH